MRTALLLGVVGLAGLAGCVTVAPGVGGSGIDLVSAEGACKEAASAMGADDLNWVEEVRFTSATTARIRFDRLGWMRPDAFCYYDVTSGAASVR